MLMTMMTTGGWSNDVRTLDAITVGQDLRHRGSH